MQYVLFPSGCCKTKAFSLWHPLLLLALDYYLMVQNNLNHVDTSVGIQKQTSISLCYTTPFFIICQFTLEELYAFLYLSCYVITCSRDLASSTLPALTY